MNITLSPDQVDRLIQARKDLHLSKTEFSYQAKVSLRTINDLESGHRNSFSEATLLNLCRALELDYSKFLDGTLNDVAIEESRKDEGFTNDVVEVLGKVLDQKREKPIGFLIGIVVGIFLLTAIVISIAVITNKQSAENAQSVNYQRRDYINPYDINKFRIAGRDAKATFDEGQIINYVKVKSIVQRGESFPAELKWSYNYEGSPEVFVNAYAEWDPDTEIKLFHGSVTGEGSKTARFGLYAPIYPGQYRVRIFYALAHAPIMSFYGSPPPDDQLRPMTAPFNEITIEVLPEQM